MQRKYDNDNVFLKILEGKIPCNKVYEDESILAFHDISPKAPVHVLVIPKNKYVSFNDFMEKATNEEVLLFFRVAQKFYLPLNKFKNLLLMLFKVSLFVVFFFISSLFCLKYNSSLTLFITSI